MASSLTIYGIKIEPGHKLQIDMPISRLPTHTLIDIPIFVFRGKLPGPTLLLTAGIHGDEVNGIEVVRRLIHDDLLMPKCGAVVAIPLVNIYGFLHNSRELPDGKDLNRSFPGSQAGSLANRLAWALMSEIIPKVDFGVDFHTGGARRTNYPQIRCVTADKENMDLARAFGAPFILDSEMIAKSFRKEAKRLGKTLIVYEGGESMRFDDFAIQEGIWGVKRLMNSLGMTNFRVEPRESILLGSSTWMRAKIGGLFRPLVAYGDKVVKNQICAFLTDPYGDTQSKVKATHDGFVIGLNNSPVVNAGDALIHLGMP